MKEGGQGAAVGVLGLVLDDTAALVFMLLAHSQPMQKGSMTQVPKGSRLIS